jgi:hypothetical protein
MAYEYHGKSDLIALPNTTQRMVDGNIVVIEKDYAIRRDRLPDALESLAPGEKMPGTNYIIDTPADIQLSDDGFARIRLSGLDVDLAAESFNIEQKNIGIDAAAFTFSIGRFSYKRSIFSESQDPNYPDTVIPDLFQSDPASQVTFGGSRWIGLTVNKSNLYENRVFNYNVLAICAPSNVTIVTPGATAIWTLAIGYTTNIPNRESRSTGYGPVYILTSRFGPAVDEADRIARLNADLAKAEAAFQSAYRMNGTGMNIVADQGYSQALRDRINRLRAQLGQ